jgi:hypothetical protein
MQIGGKQHKEYDFKTHKQGFLFHKIGFDDTASVNDGSAHKQIIAMSRSELPGFHVMLFYL